MVKNKDDDTERRIVTKFGPFRREERATRHGKNYSWKFDPCGFSGDTVELKRQIDALHKRSPFYQKSITI